MISRVVRALLTLGVALSVFAALIASPSAASYSASDWTCVPAGRKCTFGSDCCSKNCVHDPKLGKVCKAKGASWTCVPLGRKCTFGSDCCSKNCVHDPKIGKVCKPKDASWTCVPQGRKCTFGSDCCSKNCVHDPKLGKICKQPRQR
jgi:hypothetical protein